MRCAPSRLALALIAGAVGSATLAAVSYGGPAAALGLPVAALLLPMPLGANSERPNGAGRLVEAG